ncbi:hypothetical protein DPEC_G00119680 [Dallia pectoralis]|uniref:Uncharacterized protein n=1 Tax=Dallia pectoralis TaxID=75939 RepID=A0ACC2GQ78_DALPE|nr:hypothetical protein DPEC_G00119680 [Dallia pectoralis]
MDSPPKLSGETLIVHHLPLVHCQVAGGRHSCGTGGNSLKRPNTFSQTENLGLSRTTSLPERDILQREALVYSSLIQTCSGGGEGGGDRGGSTGSNDSSVTSSNSEEHGMASHTLPRVKRRERGNPPRLRHNPFLLNAEEDDDEEEDEDGDDLNGYLEDSSFHLHGDTDTGLGVTGDGLGSFHLHDLGFPTHEPFLLHSTLEKHPWGCSGRRDSLGGVASDLSAHLEGLDLLGLDGPRRHGSSGSTLSMDCGEQEWAEEEEDDGHGVSQANSSSGPSHQQCSCCGLSQAYPEHFPEPFGDYGSDSSCNSSDGVLVNFSAIYNKMNNGVPATSSKTPIMTAANLNNANDHSCTSSVLDGDTGRHGGSGGGGAFYLDLHHSPTETPNTKSHQPPCPTNNTGSLLFQPHTDQTTSSSFCTCSAEHQGAIDLDDNCNSFHPLRLSDSGSDISSCLQTKARLVVATQNYYKLVTCDLSSQSSPSPAGSSTSVTSCSDEHSKDSPVPDTPTATQPDTPTATQPTEYYLFRHPSGGEEEETEEEQGDLSQRDDDEGEDDDEERLKGETQQMGGSNSESVIEGQVYVNISPPLAGQVTRPRSRSYDRNLDKSPPPRLGSLERMLSCPVRLSEGAAPPGPPPPPRVTSFAEIARSKRRNGGNSCSPSLRMGACTDPFSSTHSAHSSTDFSPILEGPGPSDSRPFQRCYSQGSVDHHSPGGGAREARSKAEGCLSSSSSSSPVVRYTKEQRPTTLPIQPFTFQHQFSKPAQPKPLLPLLTGYISGMQQARDTGSSGGPEGGEGVDGDPGQGPVCRGQGGGGPGSKLGPGSVRPSPLGSYSPVRLQGASSSSGTCSTCTPSPQPPRSLSCPLSAGLLPLHPNTPPPHTPPVGALKPQTPPPLGVKRCALPPALPPVHGQCYHQNHRGTLPVLPTVPQDCETSEGCEEMLCFLEGSQEPGPKTQHGKSVKQLQYYSDFLPDYFSLTERPPDEFCLSPDASSSSSSSSSTQSHVAVDLQQKRGLVKAINTAVDLIVAHFGTSRNPDVKSKLGNSWVSANVGHLILKYLCPALREVLEDGLKAYVLDLIIGQRRNQPWNLVEASTQLGPSTRLLHSMFSKVSQFSELNNHSMRLNAFIFGLLNLRSLEFWFNHLYSHEDIVAAHYHPWGFLPLSQGPCQPMFEELLLLLQPLSLLPFDLDLLFEPRLIQKNQEHLRSKEQLCSASADQSLDQSRSSTFQLMRGWSSDSRRAESIREAHKDDKEGSGTGKREKPGLRREGTWPRMYAVGEKGPWDGKTTRTGSARDEDAAERLESGLLEAHVVTTELGTGFANLWRESGRGRGLVRRTKGVGGGSLAQEVEKERRSEKRKERDSVEEGRLRQERDRQAGWWHQLMQSSQVYIDQSAHGGCKFVKSEKRKRSSERRSHSTSQIAPGRESVVKGAESSQEDDRSRKSSSSSSGGSSGSRGRPSWMGSPPESVLTQDKDPGPLVCEDTSAQPVPQAEGSSPGPGMRWSRLFGSNMGSAGSPSRQTGADQRPVKTQKSRLPSGWLVGLDMSVLDLVAQTVGAGMVKRVEPSAPPASPTVNQPSPSNQLPQETQTEQPCMVRALCHHIATEPDQLSFQKGDVLRVLSRADSDWLLCSLGTQKGLVPIIYVTLRSLGDSQGPHGPH